MTTAPPPPAPRTVPGTLRNRTIAAGVALGAAILLALSPLVAGAVSGATSIAVVDMRPGGGLPDDTRLATEISRNADADVLVLVPPSFEDFITCGQGTRIPQTCTALAGLRHTVRIAGYNGDGRGRAAAGDPEGRVLADGTYVDLVATPVGGDFGFSAAVRTAMVTALLTAVAFFVALLRGRRRPTPVPVEPAPRAVAAPPPLPDDVLAAIPPRVTAVTGFGPQGGFVDAGGVLVWAALTRPGEDIRPGRSLTVLSTTHERDSLLVTPREVRS